MDEIKELKIKNELMRYFLFKLGQLPIDKDKLHEACVELSDEVFESFIKLSTQN